ncbi:MAG: metal ABC transporter permease, partial [Verrucomicrobia bacterium]|nr:metal ABC transporter permease [Verrucomicrobiota bacterium]
MNPYVGQNFFGFFVVLLQRAFSFFNGGLVSDEIQCIVLILLGLALAFLG